MNKTEVKKLFLIINNCYQNFQIDNVKTEIWLNILQDIDFETAQRNLRDHIRSNKYPPTIADIVRYDPEQFTDYDRLKIETEERFAEMEQWRREAVPMPEHLKQKYLNRGDGQ